MAPTAEARTTVIMEADILWRMTVSSALSLLVRRELPHETETSADDSVFRHSPVARSRIAGARPGNRFNTHLPYGVETVLLYQGKESQLRTFSLPLKSAARLPPLTL